MKYVWNWYLLTVGYLLNRAPTCLKYLQKLWNLFSKFYFLLKLKEFSSLRNVKTKQNIFFKFCELLTIDELYKQWLSRNSINHSLRTRCRCRILHKLKLGCNLWWWGKNLKLSKFCPDFEKIHFINLKLYNWNCPIGQKKSSGFATAFLQYA